MGSRQPDKGTQKKRSLRKWGIILAGVFIALVIATIGANIYLKNMLNNRLRNMVHTSSHGVYRLEYSSLSVNILSGSLVLRDVQLRPDSTTIARLKQIHSAPKYIVDATTSRLAFKNVKWLALLNKKELSIGKLVIRQPHLSITYFKNDSSITATDTANVSNQLKELRIGLLSLEKATIEYHLMDSGKLSTHNVVNHLDLDISKIKAAGMGSGEPQLTASDYHIRLEQYERVTADSLYRIGFKGLDFDSEKRRGRLASFYALPRFAEKEFAQKFNHQETRYEIKLNDIRFDKVNINSLNNNGWLVIEKLDVGNGTASMFMDRSLPPVQADDGEVVISKKIVKLDLPFSVQEFNLNNFEVRYGEYNPASGETARLAVEKISLKGKNLTNISGFINRQNQFTVAATGRFLNAEVKMDFNFDLASPEGRFTSKLKANQIAADQLNPILSAIAKIEARKGILKQLEASITGNENQATANVNFLYEGLKINILQKEGDTLKKKGLKTMFANLFVMDDNPKDGVLRTAKSITRQRPPGKSFFNMLWGSIAAGIKDIITDKKGFGAEAGL